ncbi:MAG: hypothetical protein JW908_09160 [Anaerolineales bacterium]|nr:hypothetical protein [Anaerolineales bacterium]
MKTTDTERPDVKAILQSLKDFQRDTVEYVFRRLYKDEDRVSRFLIADEVGLGKTLVARGIIARAIDELWNDTERIDVVYICSNQQIAQQNIDRLNITQDRHFQFASRATLLPITIQQLQKNKLNFVSLTPGTSFNLRSRTGRAWERVVLYYMLRKAWDTQDGTLSNFLRGDVLKSNWNSDIRWFRKNKKVDRALQQAFEQELAKHSGLRDDYEKIAGLIGSRRTNIPGETKSERNKFIGKFRGVLAHSSLGELQPDLIILDEFQRFKNILDEKDDMAVLAKELFEFRDATTEREAKVILLSATPYKMYTIRGEEDEDHYKDFIHTTRFLLEHMPGSLSQLEAGIENFRRSFFKLSFDREAKNDLLIAKSKIEDALRKVMVRTERLAVSKDRNGMLTETQTAKDRVEPQDLTAFVHLDKIAQVLQVEDQVEYWKSSAYPVNLMDQYKLKREFRKTIKQEQQGELYATLENAQPHLLDWELIQGYQNLDPNNARLRALAEQSIESNNWQLLWLPASLPYYAPNWDSPYANQTSEAGTTKTLVFSSWRIVPKVIAIMLSYEAERLIIGENQKEFQYDKFTSQRSNLLRFTKVDGRLTGMPIFSLLYPCMTLAEKIDPLFISREFEQGNPTSFYVILKVREKIKDLLNQATASIREQRDGRDDDRWYWAALALLDRRFYRNSINEWFQTTDAELAWHRMLKPGSEDDQESGFVEHVREFIELFKSEKVSLGKKPDDLEEVLARVALAGPAVAALRALIRVTDTPNVSHVFQASAAQVGLGFRKLFNQPDTITLLQNLYPDEDYWQAALHYCVDGNLQAVLDEYVHILNESIGVFGHDPDESASKIVEKIKIALALDAQRNFFDNIKLDTAAKAILPLDPHAIRCRYALRFGSEQGEEIDGNTTDGNIREAFNSPFRPFVLATTSIGQEGLDFHQYCHRIVHWNLPSNPVDLEQREGRIHRYKGHVIRRNIAHNYGLDKILQKQYSTRVDPWLELFKYACGERPEGTNELMPYWIFDQGIYSIERHVPLLPLSREVSRLKRLKNSLVVYRSVIGQPRQEELLQFLDEQENLSSEEKKNILAEAVIDLSPPVIKNL